MKFVAIVLFAVFAVANSGRSPHGEEFLRSFPLGRTYIPKSVLEDTILDLVEIVKKYGYPIEEHRLQTEDKYFVTLFHISHGIRTKCKTRTPIFLMHGMYGSATAWIVQGPEKALAYILAEECFDVWLGNSRGTYLSRGSSEITDTFWNYSFNEIGYYDAPRMIDFILQYTNKTKIHCIGHSQGTTVLFAMTAGRPEYNKKIKTLTALAPIAFMVNVTSPILNIVTEFSKNKDVFEHFMGKGELVPDIEWLKKNAETFCDKKESYFPICTNFLFQLHGVDPEAINKTMIPVYMGHEPGGGSVNEILHHTQNLRSQGFRKFNHGIMKNIDMYNSTEPPSYDLKKITVPVSLYYGITDTIAVESSVKLLADHITNLKKLELIPVQPFNHMDFLYRINAKEIFYDRMINEIKAYD